MMRCDKMTLHSLAKSLKGFCNEYDIDWADIYYDYEPAQYMSGYLGICRYKYHNDRSRYCIIGVRDIFEPSTIASHVIAWHEFCHAEIWIKNGTTDGHSVAWIKRVMRKPLTFIGGEFYLLFAYLYRSIRK